MAGNELEVCRFILANINRLSLSHLGVIEEIAAPLKGSTDLKILNSSKDLSIVSTPDSRKKADIYLNTMSRTKE